MTSSLTNTPHRSYRDYLPEHHREPLHIARTNKRAGQLVLGNATQPLAVVQGRRGSFRGYLA